MAYSVTASVTGATVAGSLRISPSLLPKVPSLQKWSPTGSEPRRKLLLTKAYQVFTVPQARTQMLVFESASAPIRDWAAVVTVCGDISKRWDLL